LNLESRLFLAVIQSGTLAGQRSFRRSRSFFALRKKVFARGKKVFIPGKKVFAQGKKVFIPGKKVFAQGKKVFIPGKNVFAQGKNVFIPGKKVFVRGKKVFIPEKKVFSPGKKVSREWPESISAFPARRAPDTLWRKGNEGFKPVSKLNMRQNDSPLRQSFFSLRNNVSPVQSDFFWHGFRCRWNVIFNPIIFINNNKLN
jgi:hypothetical protein